MDKSKGIKCALRSVAVIAPILISAPLHFLYRLTGCPFIAVFSPINESVAEHAKIILYPILISSCILYFAIRLPAKIQPQRYFSATLAYALSAEYVMVTVYYLLFSGFGLPEKLHYHIALEVISVTIGLGIGYHMYKKGNPKSGLPILITLLAVTVILMTIFTFVDVTIPMYSTT